MSYTFNGKTLLEAALRPLAQADFDRLVQLVDETAGSGAAFIARWSPHTGVCFTATVVDGEVGGWMMFPAANEEAARRQAMNLRQYAIATLQGFTDPAEQTAAAAIDKAKRH